MDKDKVIDKLTTIFDLELSGVIRYTHYSLMIFGPNRLPLIDFFKAQATESLLLKKHSIMIYLRYYPKL